MKILLIFTFFLIIAGTDAVTTVTGYRGRSVQIKCPYESGKEQNKKYLCRGECPYLWTKDIPVQSGSPPKETRFSLYDNTTARVFIITITDLRTEDGGTYWCTIQQKLAQDIYTEILLLVKTGFPTTLVISAVSVVLVLLIVAFIFIVMIQRKKKTQGMFLKTKLFQIKGCKECYQSTFYCCSLLDFLYILSDRCLIQSAGRIPFTNYKELPFLL
ncbi:CMRF35-like molecule 8 isoform X2 [Hemibagrus wyckioides]|uniref:CMRF35-like molecule 8 isoform X2 n=1 Tax=Hemibagrus wyckioides TaxID=337641 RepID=UPI00266D3721|nr:CMRF35-like molecule 8 isoform X2 [Hemibagrus wyckioides]